MPIKGFHVQPRTTSTDQAFNSILAAIMDGSIPPGATLPLKSIAESLGMSMMPVREAIRQLEATGIVESLPHRGARVRPISEDDLEDTYLARIEIESSLVGLAAAAFDESAAEAAHKALDEQQLAIARGDAVGAHAAHETFHHTIYRSSGSEWLFRSMMPAWHNSERYRTLGLVDPLRVNERRHTHQEILAACIAGDPSAAKTALQNHFLSVVKDLNPNVAERLATRLQVPQAPTK